MKAVCGEYRAHNADVYMREDCDIDDLVDVIEGSRIYIPCIYAVNKIVRAPLIPPLKLVLAAPFPAATFCIGAQSRPSAPLAHSCSPENSNVI